MKKTTKKPTKDGWDTLMDLVETMIDQLKHHHQRIVNIEGMFADVLGRMSQKGRRARTPRH